MNGEGPSVPITTLAGIQSLTDLLLALPQPSPLHGADPNRSILQALETRQQDDAPRLLATPTPLLVSQLADALQRTNTDNIDVLEGYSGPVQAGQQQLSQLVQHLIASNPLLLKGVVLQPAGPVSQQPGTPHSWNQYPSFPGSAGGTPQTPAAFSPSLCSPDPNASPHQQYVGNNSFYPRHPGALQQTPQPGAQKAFPVGSQGYPPNATHHDHSVAGILDNNNHNQQQFNAVGANKYPQQQHYPNGNCGAQEIAAAQRMNNVSMANHVATRSQQPNLDESGTKPAEQSLPPKKQVIRRSRGKDPKAFGPSKSRTTPQRNNVKAPEEQSTMDMYASSLSERVKRRRRATQASKYSGEAAADDQDDETKKTKGNQSDSDGDFEVKTPSKKAKVSPPSPPALPPEPPVEKKPQIKKIKKEPRKEVSTTEELMETNTYQRFNRTIETIFDAMEDLDTAQKVEDDEAIPDEWLISHPLLRELTDEAAKLKVLRGTNQVPSERLIRLLGILERNVMDGARLCPTIQDSDGDEDKLWMELMVDRITRSADASLTALYIMTSPDMPEKVFLEDIIERIVQFVKFQVQNTVYPVYDPVYRTDNKGKDSVATPKQKRNASMNKSRERSIQQLYNKLHELVGLLAELLKIQTLTDTIILQVSTLGVSPFFVEGVSELQLSALRLVTAIFSRYHKHRQLILEDILASIARLPTSKRSLRNYRLNSEEHIQMLTALVLQLIHSVVRLPTFCDDDKHKDKERKEEENKSTSPVEKEVLIVGSYDDARRTAISFLSVFLKKCGSKHDELDYRPLFENFVQDLLATVNKPEWPASELLLSDLGSLLVKNFSNKSLDMGLRVASLDYLGVVAARLRRDAVQTTIKRETIDEILRQIQDPDELDNPEPAPKKKHKKKKHSSEPKQEDDEISILQRALLHYLDVNMDNDPSMEFSKRFYLAQWYRDSVTAAKMDAKNLDKIKEEKEKSPKKHKKRNCVVESDEEEEKKEEPTPEQADAQLLKLIERRKKFIVELIRQDYIDQHSTVATERTSLDYDTAEMISRFLASRRPFSQSFDHYLHQILRVLGENATAVRTKAMKCLTHVVEADPGILARRDMQLGVHARLLDTATSVREAAVDLVGKYILVRPELTQSYYSMLTERILDTGVSVRKRVIKILKDVCIEQPDFEKVPEICVKIIRRVNDEEGIRKLVGETFQSMWFHPINNPDRVLQKVKNITHVVSACKDIGLEWFEQLLSNLLKNKDDPGYKTTLKACREIVDCLVQSVLQLECSSEINSAQHLVACFTTLHLFTKIEPSLTVKHANTIQPYLSMRCSNQSDVIVLQCAARCLELVVPLIDHPSESFLAQIEEDLTKHIMAGSTYILPAVSSCYGAVCNKVTKNYQLTRDCAKRLFNFLSMFEKDPVQVQQRKPQLLRSLVTTGHICRQFDFDNLAESGEANDLKTRVFDCLIFFNRHEDEVIRKNALLALGYLLIRHYDLMLGESVRDLYRYILTSQATLVPPYMKCIVLRNITQYLYEEEQKMIQRDAEWAKMSKKENLKEMGDLTSGMASTVVQIYLRDILDSVLNSDLGVRKAALHVIQLVLGQGLVHPVQMVPYLVCLGSDDDKVTRTMAEKLLQELEKKYPGFVQMKALEGVRHSYRLQKCLSETRTDGSRHLVRGFRDPTQPVARNGYLYSVLRSTRQSRRAFLLSLLKSFDEQYKSSLSELLYIGDNVVYFPYQVQDEPLFLMHHIDIILSVNGPNILQAFKDELLPREGVQQADELDEEEDDPDALITRLPDNLQPFYDILNLSHGCMLLLAVKQALKEMYGLTDSKIQQYSPTEAAKVYERPVQRKLGVLFQPQTTLDELAAGDRVPAEREELIQRYLDFRMLMLSIDPDDEEDEDGEGVPRQPPLQVVATTPLETKVNGPDAASAGSGPNGVVNPNRITTTISLSKIRAAQQAAVAGKRPHITATIRAPRAGPSSSSSGHHHHHHHNQQQQQQHNAATSKGGGKKRGRKKKRRVVSDESSDEDDDSDPSYFD